MKLCTPRGDHVVCFFLNNSGSQIWKRWFDGLKRWFVVAVAVVVVVVFPFALIFVFSFAFSLLLLLLWFCFFFCFCFCVCFDFCFFFWSYFPCSNRFYAWWHLNLGRVIIACFSIFFPCYYELYFCLMHWYFFYSALCCIPCPVQCCFIALRNILFCVTLSLFSRLAPYFFSFCLLLDYSLLSLHMLLLLLLLSRAVFVLFALCNTIYPLGLHLPIFLSCATIFFVPCTHVSLLYTSFLTMHGFFLFPAAHYLLH